MNSLSNEFPAMSRQNIGFNGMSFKLMVNTIDMLPKCRIYH